MRDIQHKLSVARGEAPAELLFKNARLVNVLSGEIHETNVAVDDGRVIGFGDYDAKQIIDIAGAYLAPRVIDGHAPGLRGKNLNAYALAGVRSDHESTELEEAREKLRLGLHLLVREGSTERNLEHIIALVTPQNSANCSFATDDKLPGDLVNEGHIDHSIRKAIALGVPPITAIQIGTIHTARYYRLKNQGAIAPRYWADFIVFDDLKSFHVRQTYKKGELVAEDGNYLGARQRKIEQPRSTMNLS